MQTFDVIDAVVDLGLAGIAVVLAAVVLLSTQRSGTLTIRGRTLRRARLWGSALLLLGVVLMLRFGIQVVPSSWRDPMIMLTIAAAAALLIVLIMAVVRSRRP